MVSRWTARLDFTQRQRLRFHLQVNLGIDVRRLKGDVAQPCPDRIDINSSPQQMNRRGVPDGMGTHLLGR